MILDYYSLLSITTNAVIVLHVDLKCTFCIKNEFRSSSPLIFFWTDLQYECFILGAVFALNLRFMSVIRLVQLWRKKPFEWESDLVFRP